MVESDFSIGLTTFSHDKADLSMIDHIIDDQDSIVGYNASDPFAATFF